MPNPTEEGRIAGELPEFERDVLRTACGDDRMTGWGAAVTEAAEALKARGLFEGYYTATKLGRLRDGQG